MTAPALRYRAVLFDLDGTLVDSRADIVAAVRHAAAVVRPGGELPDDEDIVAVIGKPLDVVQQELNLRLPPGLVVEFVRGFREYYGKHFRDHITVYPSVLETLAALKSAGVNTGLVTTKQQEQAEAVAAATGIDRWLDVVHGWQEGRRHKPDPEPVVDALRRVSADPVEALFVGDTEQDIIAGRNAGVTTCAVTYGYRPAALLRLYCPDFTIARFADVYSIAVADG